MGMSGCTKVLRGGVMVWVRVRGVEVCRAATRPRVCMRHCSTEFRKHVLPRLPNPCVHSLRVRMDGGMDG